MTKIRALALLLAVALLCGCSNAADTAQTTLPAATEPSETVPVSITTEELLHQALENQARVVLAGDIQVTHGPAVKGHVLDGSGYTVTAPVYNEDDPSTYCGIFITEGTVENITVKGGHRGIGTGAEYRANGDIRLKNVHLDGENCGLYIGQGNNAGGLFVDSSTLGSQTVFNKVTRAQFTNCTFHWNESGTKGNLTAYTDVELIDCRFENKIGQNGAVERYTLSYPRSLDSLTMTLENCYVGDTLITQDNIGTLLNVRPNNCRIQVHNTVG